MGDNLLLFRWLLFNRKRIEANSTRLGMHSTWIREAHKTEIHFYFKSGIWKKLFTYYYEYIVIETRNAHSNLATADFIFLFCRILSARENGAHCSCLLIRGNRDDSGETDSKVWSLNVFVWNFILNWSFQKKRWKTTRKRNAMISGAWNCFSNIPHWS